MFRGIQESGGARGKKTAGYWREARRPLAAPGYPRWWRCGCTVVGEANAGEVRAVGQGLCGQRRIQRGGAGKSCAVGARVAGGSDAQLLGSRAGRRRLRPRPSFRGSALHQVRLTERSPCPSRTFSPAERRALGRGAGALRVSARVCLCVCGGSASSGNPILQPALGSGVIQASPAPAPR